MANIVPKGVTASIEGDFVVFLIGMRINRPWKIHKWLPVFLAMPRMLNSPKGIVQYWRSFEHLEAYARDQTSRTGRDGWEDPRKPAEPRSGLCPEVNGSAPPPICVICAICGPILCGICGLIVLRHLRFLRPSAFRVSESSASR